MKTENKLITLTVERERKNAYHITTILKDSKGKVKAIFSNMINQPRKGTKTITLNNFVYSLNWSKVLTVLLFFACGIDKGLNGGWL